MQDLPRSANPATLRPVSRSAASRRSFLAAGSALLLVPGRLRAAQASQDVSMFQSNRPPVAERRFVSKVVEREIDRVTGLIRDPELAWLFGNCFPNTLDTTVFLGEHEGHDDAFVITGDIPALWLRDSAAQLRPYLHLARHDDGLCLLAALRQATLRQEYVQPCFIAHAQPPLPQRRRPQRPVRRDDAAPLHCPVG